MQYLQRIHARVIQRASYVALIVVLSVWVSSCGESVDDSEPAPVGEFSQQEQSLEECDDQDPDAGYTLYKRECECNPRCGVTFCLSGRLLFDRCENLQDADGDYDQKCAAECDEGGDPIQMSLPEVGVPTFADRIAYLFSSGDPLQTGTPWWTNDPQREERLAALAGRVFDTAGDPLSGVTISIRGTNDYGTTESRYDGDFELAVDCGEELLVDFELDAHLSVQRRVTARCQEFNRMDGVVMTPQNPQTTRIDLSAPVMVAEGGEVTDADGTREAVAFFPSSIGELRIERSDGTTSSLSPPFDVRITEYTEGAGGLAAMPGELPPSTAYTYAAELSVEDPNGQIDIGAADTVRFLEPDGSGGMQDVVIPVYVDNFLGFPTGERVPAGFYDRDEGGWKASNDGCVIEITGESNGEAVIGGLSSDPDHPCHLNLTSDELETLWAKYGADVDSTGPKSLWRVAIPHFSPWDLNWPWGPPQGAVGPDIGRPKLARQHPDPCRESGSIIECENRILSEFQPLTGTGTSLVYNSGRSRGYETGREFKIPLMGTEPATPPDWIEWKLEVAGKLYSGTAQPADDLSETVTWNGRDLQGRTIHGAASYGITVSWVYEGVRYEEPGAWQQSFGGAGRSRVSSSVSSRTAAGSGAMGAAPASGQIPTPEFRFTRTFGGIVDGYRPGRTDFGQWTLADEHVYDATSNRLIRGDGSTRRFDMILGQVTTVAGDGTEGPPVIGEDAVETGIADLRDFAIGPEGTVHMLSGEMTTLNNGEQTNHFTAPLVGTSRPVAPGALRDASIEQLELGEDGRVYYSEFVQDWNVPPLEWDCAPLKVLEDGSTELLVGAGVRSDELSTGYRGSPAVPCFNSIRDIERGPNDTTYLLVEWARPDRGNLDFDSIVATLTADGILTVVAGGDVDDLDKPDFSQQPFYEATAVTLGGASGGGATDIEVDSKGNVYIAAQSLEQILKLHPDGRLERIAGTGETDGSPLDTDPGFELDGRLAGSTDIDAVKTITVDRQNRLYFSSSLNGNSDGVTNADLVRNEAIYRVENNRIRHFAGARGEAAQAYYGPDGATAAQTTLFEVAKMEFGSSPKPTLYVNDLYTDTTSSNTTPPKFSKLRRIRDPKGGLDNEVYRIPSSDGTLVYIFDKRGLHLRTEDAITGTVLQVFERDADSSNGVADGTLLAIQGSKGGRVEIDRTTSGGQVLIEGMAPGVAAGSGFEYVLDLAQDGLVLSKLTRPDGSNASFDYGAGELLTKYVDVRGYSHRYEYDFDGNLKFDDQPNGSKTLIGSSDGDEIDVDVKTEEGLVTNYSVMNAQSGLYSRTVTYPGGAQREERSPADTGGVCRYTPLGTSDDETYECRLTKDIDYMRAELHFAADPREEFAGLVRYLTRVVESVPKVEPGHSTHLTRTMRRIREKAGQLQSGESVKWLERTTRYRDTDGNPDTESDLQGYSWEMGYNAEPDRIGADYSWIALSPEGRRTEQFFDADGRLLEVDGPGPWKSIYTYYSATDQLQNVEVLTDTGRSRDTSFSYDFRGRIGTVRSPSQQTMEYQFKQTDPPGLPDYVEHKDGSSLLRKVDFGWDRAGNMVSLETPRSTTHEQGFAPNGLLEQYSPPVVDSQPSTHYKYDKDNRLRTVILPNQFTTIDYSYDPDGFLDFVRGKASGTYHTYIFDKKTRQISKALVSDGVNYDFAESFNWNGSLLSSVSRSYHFLPTLQSLELDHEYYDGDFLLKSRNIGGCYPCKVEFDYNKDGSLTRVGPLDILRDGASDGNPFGWSGVDTNTGLIKATRGDFLSLSTDHVYDDFGQFRRVDYEGLNGFSAQFEVKERDAVGRAVVRRETIERVQTEYKYHYNPKGFLQDVYVDGVRTYSYYYDSNGNRTSMWDRRAGKTKLYEGAYDVQDRIRRWRCNPKWDPCFGGGQYPYYEYDYRDDLSLEARRRTDSPYLTRDDYTYDEWGNITEVETSNKRISYKVDAMNRRVGRLEDGERVTRGFVWSAGNQILAEIDEDGDVVSRFVYATKSHVPDLMYSKKAGSWQWYRFVTDERGSVRLVVAEEDEKVVQRIDYTPFGRVTKDTNRFFQPFGFAGGIYDPDTGLVRFGARDYDPFLGRWTNKDPIRFAGGDTNLYAYVGNDPVNFIDPSGLFGQIVLGGFGGAILSGTGYFGYSMYSGNTPTWGGFLTASAVGFAGGAMAATGPAGVGIGAAGLVTRYGVGSSIGVMAGSAERAYSGLCGEKRREWETEQTQTLQRAGREELFQPLQMTPAQRPQMSIPVNDVPALESATQAYQHPFIDVTIYSWE